MDPSTVITLLALNLIGVGGLLHLIARRMADPAGLRNFGTGAMLFGVAYLSRLLVGFSSGTPVGLVSDMAMIGAMLFFASGLQQFSGLVPMRGRTALLLLAVYVLVAGWATVYYQGVGRHAALNLGLGLAYAVLSVLAVVGAQREIPALHWPLRLLSLMVAVLALLTLARGVAVVQVGTGPLFAGPWAQAYYGYSILFTMLLGPNLLWMVFVRLNERLNELATRDALTLLLNRNGLEEVVRRHFGSRPPPQLVLLLLDIDHFKHINDTHGHAAGDLVLRGVGQALTVHLRKGDVVARWGGEEFLVCCVGADTLTAVGLAERLRLAVEASTHLLPDGQVLRCTVSVGVSGSLDSALHWQAATRAADEALYRAKHAGRNRVVPSVAQPAA
jgi:diguanylate cyclase (GGDEF)-like protein